MAEKWQEAWRRVEYLSVLAGGGASYPAIEAELARRGVKRAGGEDVDAAPVGPAERAIAARALARPGARVSPPARGGWRLNSEAIRALAAATALIVLAGLVALFRRLNLRLRPRVLAAV